MKKMRYFFVMIITMVMGVSLAYGQTDYSVQDVHGSVKSNNVRLKKYKKVRPSDRLDWGSSTDWIAVRRPGGKKNIEIYAHKYMGNKAIRNIADYIRYYPAATKGPSDDMGKMLNDRFYMTGDTVLIPSSLAINDTHGYYLVPLNAGMREFVSMYEVIDDMPYILITKEYLKENNIDIADVKRVKFRVIYVGGVNDQKHLTDEMVIEYVE